MCFGEGIAMLPRREAGGNVMTLSDRIAPHLPYLRRYARALTGSQASGDAYVVATLETLIAAPDQLPEDLETRSALYRVFHAIWSSTSIDAGEPEDDDPLQMEHAARKRLSAVTPLARQALLLTTLEGFTRDQAATILQIPSQSVAALVSEAIDDIERQTATSVLIIEDEPIIALDLKDIVQSLGHEVADLVDTRDKAVLSATRFRPGLVLADIQLADGSSGIDAVNDILTSFDVPVIFITAFPERLLTGQRPEPAFLITKPFHTELVKAAVSQALFFERLAKLPT
jgi:DNA-directed RNA polymerase specialized sigma24 family protein/CheY-like chemotaxis protein